LPTPSTTARWRPAKLRGTVDIVTLQTLARRDDIAELTAGYGLIVADECHHVPAAAFEDAVRQVSARRWLGLTATPLPARQARRPLSGQLYALGGRADW